METGEKLQRLGEEIQSSDLGMLRCIYLLFDGRRDRRSRRERESQADSLLNAEPNEDLDVGLDLMALSQNQ